MMLTTKGRYAVMAMVDLARHSRAQPISLADIAARQEISLNYLEQIFSQLKRSQLVESVRGPGGGYTLAKEAGEISVAAVIDAVDEGTTMTRCHNGKGCMHQEKRCATHDLWHGLGNHIASYLQAISLHDVCRDNIPVVAMQKEGHTAEAEA